MTFLVIGVVWGGASVVLVLALCRIAAIADARAAASEEDCQ